MEDLKVVCVCGMGVGSSMLLKISLDEIFPKLGFNADVLIQNVGEFSGLERTDVVVTSELLAQSINIPEDALLITVNNYLDKAEIEEKVVNGLKEKYNNTKWGDINVTGTSS